MEIRCRLKVIFAERDIRQKDFAQLVGMGNNTLSQLVNNKTLPTLPIAYRISEALDLSVEEIWQKK